GVVDSWTEPECPRLVDQVEDPDAGEKRRQREDKRRHTADRAEQQGELGPVRVLRPLPGGDRFHLCTSSTCRETESKEEPAALASRKPAFIPKPGRERRIEGANGSIRGTRAT